MKPAHKIRPATGLDVLILCICAALLASSFGAITLALRELSPLQVAAARCTVAALALWLWSGVQSWMRASPSQELPAEALPEQEQEQAARLWPYSLGVGFLGYALPFALLAWAETMLSPGHTAMLFCSGPIFAVLIAWTWQKDEKSSGKIFLGMFLCTVGIALLVQSSGSSPSAPQLPAALAVLACALCYAISGVWARKAPSSSDRLTRHSLALASLILLIPCAFAQPPLPTTTPQTLWAALYLGLVPTALCSVLRYRQIRTLGYTFVSQTGYLVPTLGALIGVIFFSETLTTQQLIGLALSLAGLWWTRRYSKKAAMRSSGRGGAD